jgi:formamidopyrimidine-DNA glycosylase
MPELPEVEVVKIFLEDKLLGQKITHLEILNKKSFIGNPEQVVGQKIVKFSRIGKQLSIHLSNGKIILVHLKMTGQLIIGDTMLGHPTKFDQYPNKSTRLVFHFSPLSSKRGTKGVILYFNDQRKFGWVQVFTPELLKAFQENLGKDILNPAFTPQYLRSQLQRSSRAIKLVLLDQNFFAGIGNIYANDALFLSKINPSIPAKNITLSQSKKIHQHLVSIMEQSIAAGGSTTKDQKYVRPDGTVGGNQFFFRVYQKAGEPCPVCQTKIIRITLGGRGTFLCPKCQPAKL